MDVNQQSSNSLTNYCSTNSCDSGTALLNVHCVIFDEFLFENETSLDCMHFYPSFSNSFSLSPQELVEDKVAGGIRPRLLIYDIMQFEGSSDVSQCDHQRRLECVRRELIEPRERAVSSINHIT